MERDTREDTLPLPITVPRGREQRLTKRRLLKTGGCCLAIAFVVIQLMPYPKPLSSGTSEREITPSHPLSQMVRRSCYDCHSESRSLPWYGGVAPLSWWMADEVRRAQSSLNFSRWKDYSPRRQALIWQRSLSLIQGGQMPPPPYHFAHPVLEAGDISALKKHLLELSLNDLEDWTPEEVLAWPAGPWLGGPVQEVQQAKAGKLEEPLVLDGGLLVVEGDLTAGSGIVGQGAIMVSGRLHIENLSEKVGPVTLVGLGGVTLKAKRKCELSGAVLTAGKLETVNVLVRHSPDRKQSFGDVKQAVAEFCRDDGELGEHNERKIIVRHKDGQYVLWDPEFQKVRRANSVEEALDEIEKLLAEDDSTSIEAWKAKYRQDWSDFLKALPSTGGSATFAPMMKP